MSELALTNGHADPDVKRIVGDFGPRELVSVSKAASPQTRYALAGGVPIGDELGRSGLRHWGGFVFEEWLRELQQGRRAAEVFRDMMDSDAIVGAIMYAIEMLVRRVSWWWEPADSSRDAKQAADWCDGLLKDMRFSWPDTLSEIFSFLGYGYAYEEIVYKKRQGDSRDRLLRSKFDDNTIGVAKLALRSQDSLWKWVFDENDEIEGMIQNPPPDYLLRFIPLEKALHFRTKIFKNNPEGRSVLRSAYGCFDPMTQLLTAAGWKPVADVTLTDDVATLNDVGVIEYHKPTHLHAYDFDGDLVHVTGRYVDQMVTPNHNLYVKPQPAQCGYRFVEADKATPTSRFKASGEWLAEDIDDYVIPAWVDGGGKLWPKHRVAMDDWMRFLGIYLSEGSASRGRQATIEVSQKWDEQGDIVREWVEAIGFPVTIYENRQGRATFTISRGQVYELLAPLGKAKTKHVPDYVKNLSRRQIRLFLEAYFLGDGTSMGPDRAHRVIYTASRQMADDLMELAIKGGYSSRIRWQRTTGFTAKTQPDNGVWIVTLGTVAKNGHRGTKWERVPYAGKVYCVTVPNHTVLARRNDMASWSGNSWYFAKNMRAIEGIGVERDLAGLPMLTPPEGVDIWNPNDPAFAGERAAAQALVSSVRRDEQEGIIKPYGWQFELVSTAGARQFDVGKIITRYETRIATSVLADLVMLGQDKVGSYALAVTKKDLFASSLGAYLDIVAAQFNDELVEKLWTLNGFRWPKPTLKHGAVETVDLDTLGNYIMRLGQSGAPIDWESVLPWASVQAGMPEPKPGHDFTPRNLIRPGSDAPPKDRLTAVVKADEGDGD